ncbi:hypothetical protein ACFQX9_01630 [Bradyrhizobium sp. GCM10028915]|uniref:hypothetical protein n=1 Tax=Bradyrhizobium sp. GCM10028915 TaxID=3273385 RepID=UPI00361B57DB
MLQSFTEERYRAATLLMAGAPLARLADPVKISLPLMNGHCYWRRIVRAHRAFSTRVELAVVADHWYHLAVGTVPHEQRAVPDSV